jgi:4-hydroxy-4-methyl-2-oxoglutarate aldolase
MTPLTDEQFQAILRYDTCRVADAIETFEIRLRHQGLARPGLSWMCPSLPPMLGYACTSRMKTSHPPIDGRSYLDRTDWWQDLAALPKPLIAVIEDVDETPGFGSVAGQVHSTILQRLGCTGLVTNGAVRDMRALEAMGFGVLASGASPSHAYAHVVDHGLPVDIHGLRIQPGDLLFADRHGLVQIPLEIAAQIPAAIDRQRGRVQSIIDLCRSSEFSLERLESEVSRKG